MSFPGSQPSGRVCKSGMIGGGGGVLGSNRSFKGNVTKRQDLHCFVIHTQAKISGIIQVLASICALA